MKEWLIKNILDSKGRINSKSSKLTKELKSSIISLTNFFPKETKLGIRIASILLDIEEHPKCVCNNKLKLIRTHGNYLQGNLTILDRNYCSSKCSNSDEMVKNKKKQSYINNYGVSHPLKSKEILNKVQKTNLDKYGNICSAQGDETKEKINKTMVKKYGANHNWSSNSSVSNKSLDTYKSNTGYNHPMNDPEIIEKIQKTNLNKYNRNWYVETEDFKDKFKETSIKNWGTYHPMQSKRVKYKLKSVFNKKYGVPSARCIGISKYTLDRLQDKEWLLKQNEDKNCIEISQLLGDISPSGVVRAFKRLDIVPKKHKYSVEEKEVLSFIKKNYQGEILSNYRLNNKELDIYLPELNLAIEYNGLYWHSYIQNGNKKYHLEKTLLCEENNIQLVHIFSNEWNNKKDIIKSIILNKLGKTPNRIYARKCEIRELSPGDSREFQEFNHRQGAKNSKIKLGLYYKNELVSLMTLSKRSNKANWELDRFCNKVFTNVVGGASKLLSYFKNNYKGSIITFADRRYSDGNLYRKIGFDQIKESPINYWYTSDYINLESRQKYQKHKLHKLLEYFNKDLTEWQNMEINGYDKVYDCGNYVYLLR